MQLKPFISKAIRYLNCKKIYNEDSLKKKLFFLRKFFRGMWI